MISHRRLNHFAGWGVKMSGLLMVASPRDGGAISAKRARKHHLGGMIWLFWLKRGDACCRLAYDFVDFSGLLRARSPSASADAISRL